MNKFEVLGEIGEGAYGVVLKCRNKDTNEIVAIKKFRDIEDDEMVRKASLREVKILRMLKHPNIVSLKEAFRRKGKLVLVFEYVHNNLLEILQQNPSGLDPDLVRRYVFQLCKAIQWCHSHDIIHRDIKPENLLVNPDHSLKLCDFGFARTVQPNTKNLTDYVATRWYRAPELLIGTTRYDMSVDFWAIGCIMGELVDAQPLFPGESEIDQLYVIQRVMGPLTADHMMKFLRNPNFSGLKFPDMSQPETLQRKYMGQLSKTALSFMNGLLDMDPKQRLTGRACLDHRYFDGLHAEYTYTKEQCTVEDRHGPLSARGMSSRAERRQESRMRHGRRQRYSTKAEPVPNPLAGSYAKGFPGSTHSRLSRLDRNREKSTDDSRRARQERKVMKKSKLADDVAHMPQEKSSGRYWKEPMEQDFTILEER